MATAVEQPVGDTPQAQAPYEVRAGRVQPASAA